MAAGIHKKSIFFAVLFLFLCRNIFAGDLKKTDKYFISAKETEVKMQPGDEGGTVARLSKDVYVKSLGWEGNWLLINAEYDNLSADSLDDIDVSFSGWVNKGAFNEVPEDLIKTESEWNFPSFENTKYFFKKNDLKALADIWEANEKYFLFFKLKTAEIFNLPNIPSNVTKTISAQAPFVITLKCRDWAGANWFEAVYVFDSAFEKGWIKTLDIISEKDKKIEEETVKKIEDIKQGKISEIIKLKNEIKKLMETIEMKIDDKSKITGKGDFDKRIKGLEVQKLNKELEEKLESLAIIQSSFW